VLQKTTGILLLDSYFPIELRTTTIPFHISNGSAHQPFWICRRKT